MERDPGFLGPDGGRLGGGGFLPQHPLARREQALAPALQQNGHGRTRPCGQLLENPPPGQKVQLRFYDRQAPRGGFLSSRCIKSDRCRF
jgi:hypothetical protein